MAKKKHKAVKNMNKKDESKLFAFLATFLTIIGFVIALILKKDDDYVMFYAKQGLVLFIIQLIAVVAGMMFLVGWILSSALWILFLVLWVIAWINALSGEKRNTPIVGDFAKNIKL